MNIVAFIPLRAGGIRLGPINGLDKERAILGNHPLMAYTIRAAIDSGVFDDVIAVVRSEEHAAIAENYGATILKRPAYTVTDTSPDSEWVLWALEHTWDSYQAYSILRVTSPFRSASDIVLAWMKFSNAPDVDSLRAVTPANQDPFKMWSIQHDRLLPLYPFMDDNETWHSRGSQKNPPAWTQTASMEMAWVRMTLRTGSISGSTIMPWITHGFNAMDINSKIDWARSEQAIKNGLVKIPKSLR